MVYGNIHFHLIKKAAFIPSQQAPKTLTGRSQWIHWGSAAFHHSHIPSRIPLALTRIFLNLPTSQRLFRPGPKTIGWLGSSQAPRCLVKFAVKKILVVNQPPVVLPSKLRYRKQPSFVDDFLDFPDVPLGNHSFSMCFP